jgi:hypothetical protein
VVAGVMNNSSRVFLGYLWQDSITIRGFAIDVSILLFLATHWEVHFISQRV